MVKAPEYVIMFDESLNKISQHSLIDLIIRFWSEEKKQMVTRYFRSAFLSHTIADELLSGFQCVLDKIQYEKMFIGFCGRWSMSIGRFFRS